MVNAQYLMSLLDTIQKTVKRDVDKDTLNKNLGQVILIRKMFTTRINSIAGRRRAEELELYVYEKLENCEVDNDSIITLDISKMTDDEIVKFLDIYRKAHLLKIKEMYEIKTKDDKNETLRQAILQKIMGANNE